MDVDQSCRCHLLTSPSSLFSHEGSPCGWPTLDGPCPDCGRVDEACTFFSENEEENQCSGFTRLVTLCLLCRKVGLRRRFDAQMKTQVSTLCARADAFASGHFGTYKDAIRSAEGDWSPLSLGANSSFVFDRTGPAWRFVPGQGGEGQQSFTMSSLAALLRGPDSAAGSPSRSPRDDSMRIAELERELQLLKAAQLSEASRQAAAALGSRRSATGFGEASSTPSQAFSFSGGRDATLINSFNAPSQYAGVDASHATALREAGFSAEEVLAALRNGSRESRPPPSRHPVQWAQLAQGTSPLECYMGLVGQLRQSATPRTLRVEVFDFGAGEKKSIKHTVWPPAQPFDVAAYHWDELAAYWTQSLAQLNQTLKYVTPKNDHDLVPVIPVDTKGFLAHLRGCLDSYPVERVVRAWESAHHHFIDAYIGGRSSPSWDSAWLLPAVQVQLAPVAPRARAAAGSAVSQLCRNWNFREGRRCNPEPAADCQKTHACIVCGGDHPLVSCTQRE